MKFKVGDIVIRHFNQDEYKIRLIVGITLGMYHTKLIKTNCGGYDGSLDVSEYSLITNIEKLKYL